jgi:hypothetical protein
MYPTVITNITQPTAVNTMQEVPHAELHQAEVNALQALQSKVGIDGSIVTTTHDYKLNEVTGTDKAVGKIAVQTLTNKTLTSPIVTGATLTSSTVNGVTLSTAAGSSNVLKGDGTYGAVSAADGSFISKGSLQGLTDASTSGLNITSGVVSVNSGTAANQIVKLDGSAKLPAVDGSQLTNFTKLLSANVSVASLSSDIVVNIPQAFAASNFQKTKEIQIYYSGTVSTSFTLFGGSSNPNTTSRIYINDISRGQTRINNTSADVVYTETFKVSAGDFIQVYSDLGSNFGVGSTLKNFRLGFDVVTNNNYGLTII